MFEALYEFGWKPVLENHNVIALSKGDKNITLEPGNQIELAGAKLNNIHEACSESYEYLFELRQVVEKLNSKEAPKFSPGRQIGKAVPVKYTVPIKCTLG